MKWPIHRPVLPPNPSDTNLLTGEVLYDGAPPGPLPEVIVHKPLYRRTFSNAHFEVTELSMVSF